MRWLVGRQPFVGEPRVRSQVSPCGICGDQSGTRKYFVFHFTSVSSFHFIPPIPHIHLHLHLGFTRKRIAPPPLFGWRGNQRTVNWKELPLFNVRTSPVTLLLDFLSQSQPPPGSPIPLHGPVHLPPTRAILLAYLSAPPPLPQLGAVPQTNFTMVWY